MAVALVTGGSRGIGEAICRRLADEGYIVAVNYKNSAEKAEALAAEIGGRAYRADVSQYDEVCAMFDSVERELGPVEVLVNNAAISVVGVFQDCTDEEWEKIFGVNVKGVFNCCKRALSNMLNKQHGSIVNISSIWGVTGGSCECHYSAAKAAVIGYTKSMAKELGPSGIRVNCVAPGVIESPMNSSHLTTEELSELAEQTPLCRLGKPEEVARAVRALAENRFITGQVLGVDGGFC